MKPNKNVPKQPERKLVAVVVPGKAFWYVGENGCVYRAGQNLAGESRYKTLKEATKSLEKSYQLQLVYEGETIQVGF